MHEPSAPPIAARRLAVLLGEWETGASVYRDLADRIRLLVLDGRLPAGHRLPSERELAAVLGRSRSTVVAAYDALRTSGLASTRRGAGTVVRLPPRDDVDPHLDFAHAVPPPLDGLDMVMRRALGQVDRAISGPGFDMHGDPILRARIADRYTRRGLPTTPEQVLVTVGGQHAIGLLARLLVRLGDRVVTESPAYPHAHDAFRGAGGQVVTAPVGREGWDEAHLLTALARARPVLAYLMPDFQNPTGASMPPATRSRLCRAAVRTGTVLVVDETTADLDIDRGWDDGPFAAHASSTGASVVTIGSFGKSIWSGLRLGWVRADAALIERLARIRPQLDLGTPRLEQLVACELLPTYDDLLAVRRAQLRERRDHLKRELGGHLPEWDAPLPDGGLSFWIGLGAPVSSALALACRERGMALSAGPRFTVDGSQERFVRLPFTLAPDELTAGVAALAAAWRDLSPEVAVPASVQSVV